MRMLSFNNRYDKPLYIQRNNADVQMALWNKVEIKDHVFNLTFLKHVIHLNELLDLVRYYF